MHKKVLYIILVWCYILTPFLGHAQTVALVLSGGGAKAYSHIGVLKAIEEANIEVDYIVGNSMGALIGAFYSSGYSPSEIESILTNPDFLSFTRENTDKTACYYQNVESDASFVNFTFDVEKGFNIQFPLSVYDMKTIDYQLMVYFAYAYAASDGNFDDLMIPFRCIASDIDSSRLVVFRDGNIAKAVRASITFPFFIRPIEINETLFFDGGMYDNFPVDIAIEEFNPGLIIGSKAINNYEAPDAENAISLMQSMLMTKADFEIDSTLGIVIESNTGDGSIFQYSKVKQYIDSGYIAAGRQVENIKNRLVSNEECNISEKRKEFNDKIPYVDINNITISGLNSKQQEYFYRLTGDNDRFNSSKDFSKFYDCLIDNENVVSVYPEIIPDTNSNSFSINLLMKRSEPFSLGIGGYISSNGVNEAFIGLSYNIFGKVAKNIEVGAYYGTFYNSVNARAKIEFPSRVPLTLKLKMLISRKNYFSNARYFFEDNFPAYIISDENYLDFSIGIPLVHNSLLHSGISNINANFQYYQNNYFSRTDTADVSNYYFLSPWISYESRTLNKKLYSTRGHFFYAGFSYYSGNEKYTQGSGKSSIQIIENPIQYISFLLKYHKYFKLAQNFSIGIKMDAGYSDKPMSSNYVSTLLLATPYEPLPFMKSLFLENYRANIYGAIGTVFDYNFIKNFHLRVDGYYYVPYEKILVDDNNMAYKSGPFEYNYFAGSARLVFNPPIGVVSASVNYVDKPGSKFGFLLNIGYMIFNKSELNR